MMQYIAVSLLCSKDETIIKQVSKKKVVVCLEHSRRSFVFFVESVASGFPVRCGLISSTGCNDLISGNAVSKESYTPNC